jgi:prepilin-type N-terminal cleavage/methylation domain-containing protein
MSKNSKNKKNNFTKGFSLVEVLISVFIISMIVVIISTFQRDIFSLNFSLQGSLSAQLEARHVVKVIVTELRKAEPSNLGAYPIALASTSAVTFYSDIDSNGTREKVRYFISGSELKKGVVVPTGSPLTYNDANEKLSTLISGVVSSSTLPLFEYYPSSYTGTTSPLLFPVDIASVRLIKTTVIIDKDPNKSPVKIIVTSQVNIRNLKDNL